LLPFVPVIFDAYRLLKPRVWPVMQALVAHADRAGLCWPGVRRIAEITGVPKSTVARYLATLERDGHISRTRKPGGRCICTIAARFLPVARVSHQREKGVPPPRREEQVGKKTEARTRARFANRGVSFGELPDDRAKWETRLHGWRKSRFWLLQWGAKPGEAGCMVPAALLAEGSPC
jgi:hypothetical protein